MELLVIRHGQSEADITGRHEGYYEQETQIAFRARAETILSSLIHENAGIGRMAIVSHGSC